MDPALKLFLLVVALVTSYTLGRVDGEDLATHHRRAGVELSHQAATQLSGQAVKQRGDQ